MLTKKSDFVLTLNNGANCRIGSHKALICRATSNETSRHRCKHRFSVILLLK